MSGGDERPTCLLLCMYSVGSAGRHNRANRYKKHLFRPTPICYNVLRKVLAVQQDKTSRRQSNYKGSHLKHTKSTSFRYRWYATPSRKLEFRDSRQNSFLVSGRHRIRPVVNVAHSFGKNSRTNRSHSPYSVFVMKSVTSNGHFNLCTLHEVYRRV
jgi:hypothetical protein